MYHASVGSIVFGVMALVLSISLLLISRKFSFTTMEEKIDMLEKEENDSETRELVNYGTNKVN